MKSEASVPIIEELESFNFFKNNFWIKEKKFLK